MADRQRQTNRCNFRGLNTRLLADAMPIGKYPIAINVRADGDSKIRTRPGLAAPFTTARGLTDIGSYATLGTDNKPRILVHDSGGGVWLDDGVKKGTVGTGGLGASLIPFRPSQSPQSWMYVGNATGYKKFSAPDGANVVTAQNAGIAEPQSPPDACPDGLAYNEFTLLAAQWAQSGTAAGPSDATRTTDTVTAIFQDPASVSPAALTRYTVQFGSTVQYSTGMTLKFNKSGGGTVSAIVEDVFPPINGGTALTIQSILYLFGPAGRCIIVPSQVQVGSNNQQFDANGNPAPQLPFLPGQIAGLRRGSLITIGSGGGTETVFVLSVTTGPQNQLAIECSTQYTHAASETIVGTLGVACSGISSLVVGQTVTSAQINSAITTGVGKLTQTLGTNPFNLSLGTIGTPQENDHIHISVAVDTPTNVTEFKILFDVGDGTFLQNVLYYSITPSAFTPVLANLVTQGGGGGGVATEAQQNLIDQQAAQNQALTQGGSTPAGGGGAGGAALPPNYDPNNPYQILNNPLYDVPATSGSAPGIAATGGTQFTEAIIPITALTRIGNDQSNTLAQCVAVQVLVNCSGALNLYFGSIWVGGGGQPDLGDSISTNPTSSGASYLYRVRPRSSTTGARGNPSPETRYGVEPHRQKVIVSLPSASYDTQIDTWDIFRYGGTVTSWRYVGSASSTATTFIDNVFDNAALAGEVLDFDNFQPWPSVDVPYSVSSGVTVYGTAIEIIAASFPATISRWLPGTLVTLNGQLTYTLWNRPVGIAGGYLLRIVENAGAPAVTTLQINEPNVANQPLPYLWGPDANGIVFGAGDPLRPGALYSAKQNNPDSSPNNIYDLTPTSEPLLGGEVVDGLSLVASSANWWMLQAAFSTPNRWNPVKTPAGRGLAAPYGSCTDGKVVFFWAKDGIYYMVPGLPAISLTEQDLGNLFPNVDGIGGVNVTYATFTFYAPSYQYAADFRLSIANSMLRAHYRDSSGFARTIILDMNLDSTGQPRMAWSVDWFDGDGVPIVTSLQPDQPSGTLTTATARYPQVYLGDSLGNVYAESDLTNDNGHPIQCWLGIPEWDAGDARTQKQWIDAWVDSVPAAPTGLLVAPVAGGIAVGTQNTIAQSASRILPPPILPLGNPVTNFMGLILEWIDDFTQQSVPTQIYEWSSEFVTQPLLIRSWNSVPTSHGLQGYHHIRKVVFAYLTKGSNAVTLTITAYDGTSPVALTLPATNGAYQKVEFIPTFNKGLLFTYNGTSSDQWAPILADTEVHVGAWSRTGPYEVFQGLGGSES